MISRLKYNTRNNEISTYVAFIVIMVFGLGVSWAVIRAGEKIIQEIPAGPVSVHNNQVQQAINNIK